MVTKQLDAFSKKMDFGPKKCIFGPKFCIFLRYTYETPIFLARTVPTQWDHKSPISRGNSGYLHFSGRWSFGRLAGRFVAPIAQSGPFGVQKCCFWPETFFLWTSVQRSQQKNVVFFVSGHDGNKKSWKNSKKNGFGAKKLHFLPEILHFFTLHL